MNIQPYYYQKPIPKAIFDYLRKNKGKNPLVALPTGTGKTVVIADICEQAVEKWDIDVLILSHSKEILEQDYKTLIEHTDLDVGLYSAGLESRTVGKVTVAGIQSVYKKPELFKDVKFIIIDEAHLVSPKETGMYRQFLNNFKNVPVMGLTATKYRLGQGYIYGNEDAFFDDLVYDYTTYEKFNELIEKGFLCHGRTIKVNLKLNVEGVRTQGGDFIETDMSHKFDRPLITNAACDEVIEKGKDYKKWLFFAIDIKHAEHIAEYLIRKGIRTTVIHSKMDADRDREIALYNDDFYQAAVNVGILTTGFNNKKIDLIALLRPSKSPVYHVQTIGRATRVHPDKDHFVVFDFAGNTARLGPVNDIKIQPKRKKGKGEPIIKTCPKCGAEHHPRVRLCHCGHEFRFKHGLGDALDAPLIKDGELWAEVTCVEYSIKNKIGRPSSM